MLYFMRIPSIYDNWIVIFRLNLIKFLEIIKWYKDTISMNSIHDHKKDYHKIDYVMDIL